jgi:hypothetical protein
MECGGSTPPCCARLDSRVVAWGMWRQAAALQGGICLEPIPKRSAQVSDRAVIRPKVSKDSGETFGRTKWHGRETGHNSVLDRLLPERILYVCAS